MKWGFQKHGPSFKWLGQYLPIWTILFLQFFRNGTSATQDLVAEWDSDPSISKKRSDSTEYIPCWNSFGMRTCFQSCPLKNLPQLLGSLKVRWGIFQVYVLHDFMSTINAFWGLSCAVEPRFTILEGTIENLNVDSATALNSSTKKLRFDYMGINANQAWAGRKELLACLFGMVGTLHI